MHGFPVGWDLISLYKHMAWNDKFFALYLTLAVGFSFVQSLWLGRRLWSYSPPKHMGSRNTKREASDLLAASALANNNSGTEGLSGESDISMNSEGAEKRLHVAERAAPRFQYLWAKSEAKVTGMKNLAVLTAILSALSLSCDLMRFLPEVQSGRYPVHGDIDVAGGPAELLVPFVLGLAVCGILYALSTFFASALARRRAEWNLFVANVNIQHKAE